MRQERILSAAVLLSVLTQPSPARGDDLVATRDQPVVETAHSVKVSIDGALATIKVQRTFSNEGTIADQAELLIALPWESVATGLRIKGKDHWYDGDLMDADLAAVIYESLTGYGPWQVKDPAILFWNDIGSLSLWVFPVNPSSESTVEYTLLQPLDYRDGTYYLTYPAIVDQADLAVPTLSVTSTFKQATVRIGGVKVGQGKGVPIADRLLGGDYADTYESASQEGCEADEWDETWYGDGSYVHCPTAGEVLVAVTAPKIDTVAARYGVYALTDGRSVVRLEIDTAPLLRPRPKKASVVFVVDASRSFGEDGVAAALAFAQAFARHMPDASFEVVVFRRRAEQLFGSFVPASGWKEAMDAAPKERLAAGNGSHIEEGLRTAASILSSRPGPKRIIAFTDSLMRSAYTNSLSHDALEELPKGSVVHVVKPYPGYPGDDVETYRLDDADLAPVALGHGGILLEVDGGMEAADFEEASAELVRPTKIDGFRILMGDEDYTTTEFPDVMPEGKGLRYTVVSETARPSVTLEGRIWAEPLSRVVAADQEMSEKVVPALVFATDLYFELDETAMMAAAAAGGAVSPVTSYLAVEPGVRPSTAGFEDESSFGMGGLGLLGVGAGGGGTGIGIGTGEAMPDYASVMAGLAGAAAAHCLAASVPAQPIGAWVECTYDEIVDVEVSMDSDPVLDACLEDAIWSIALPGEFSRERLDVPFTMG